MSQCTLQSHSSDGKRENQDTLGYFQAKNASVFVVADGAGGIGGGKCASQIAFTLIKKHLEAQSVHPNPLFFSSLLAELDEEIYQNRDAGETTVVLVAVDGKKVWGASIGDSVDEPTVQRMISD